MMWGASIIGTPTSMDSEFVSEGVLFRMHQTVQNVYLESHLSCAGHSGGLKWPARSFPEEVT